MCRNHSNGCYHSTVVKAVPIYLALKSLPSQALLVIAPDSLCGSGGKMLLVLSISTGCLSLEAATHFFGPDTAS